MIIIRRLKCIDAPSGIVLSVSGRPAHRLRVLSKPVHCRIVVDVLSNKVILHKVGRCLSLY